jgi:hypothetical protein
MTLLSAEVASAAYKRRNAGVSDEEALTWGMKHRILFVSEALDVLTMMALAEVEEMCGQQTQDA